MGKRATRLSANQQHVYDALRAASRPMSAYQLLDAVREHGISAPLTVYRALNSLMDRGRVHRLASMNAFVACSEPNHRHDVPVFAICRSCSTIEELPENAVVSALSAQARHAGFSVEGATVELKGLCALCRSGEDGGAQAMPRRADDALS